MAVVVKNVFFSQILMFKPEDIFFAKIGFSKKNNVLHFFKYNSINESKREDLSITLSSSPNYELDSDGVFNCFEFVKDQT